ncbi:MAG: hypothetical protein ACJ73E_17530 [Mycobacteriales bacterium]
MSDHRAGVEAPEGHRRLPEGIWVALITAAATLGVAVIGLFGAASTGAVSVGFGAPPTEVRTVTVTVAAPSASSPSVAMTPAASSSSPQAPGGAAARSYLRDLQPADGGYKSPHPTTLGQKQYFDSIGMYCSGSTTRIVWGVPLSSRSLVAVVGIDSGAGHSAIGGTARLQFQDENGSPIRSVEVAIGRPASINVPVEGKAQLRVLCTAHNTETERRGYVPYFDVELADAAFVSSA